MKRPLQGNVTAHQHSFPDEAARAFAFLVDEFGFAGPQHWHAGAEVDVRYERGPYRIHVSMESGNAPEAEVLYPAEETGTHPAPWASSDGIRRARRLHAVRHDAARTLRWPDDMSAWLDALALELRHSEAGLLAGRTAVARPGAIARARHRLREQWRRLLRRVAPFGKDRGEWNEWPPGDEPTAGVQARRAKDLACTEAGHAYKRGDHARVVMLLTQYEKQLSRHQGAMLAKSREQLRDA